ncbi:MAG: AAA family ATPase [Candidatus Izemoplasmatales bacterium]
MSRLERIRLLPGRPPAYPFTVPALSGDLDLVLTAPVTVLIGENGSGKSTLLDLVGAKAGLVRIAQDDPLNRSRAALFRQASAFVETVFRPVRPKGFHFAASDFATYLRYIAAEKEYAHEELDRVAKEYTRKSDFAKMMAAAPAERTLAELDGMYGRDLSASSHGESYLDFFASRLRPDSLFLLDEPETPLSFQNQLALLVMIDQGVAEGCQFLIATHSPVLAGIPEADILSFEGTSIRRRKYSEIEAFSLLSRFLADREGFFENLRRE